LAIRPPTEERSKRFSKVTFLMVNGSKIMAAASCGFVPG
jgi:hypothetical protein